jgi:outer membrane receptor protein involved in Fe transport
MMNFQSKRIGGSLMKLALCSSVALCSAGAALAQAKAPADAGGNADGEIIVTAQKRSQSIQDVGMSIQAIAGAQLAARGVSTAADLGRVVPGLSVTPSNVGNSGAPVYTLRGIGFYEKSLSAVSAVAFYADEVPLPYAYMTAGPTLDLARVEVLKGPQGTLYGQNSTGGAINFFSNKPTDEFHFGGKLSYGRFNNVDGEAYVSGPITDTLKARVAFRGLNGDGWQVSATRPGDRLGAPRAFAARSIVDWTPTDKLSVEFNINGWRDRSQSQAAQVSGYNPNLQAFALAAIYPYYNQLFDPNTFRPSSIRQADWTPGEDYRNDNKLNQGSLRVGWELARHINLTSITARSIFHYRTFQDTDGSAALFNQYTGIGSVRAFSQEIRLAGENVPHLHWIAGLNYSRDKIHDFSDARLDQSTLGYFAGLSGTTAHEHEVRTTKAAFVNVDYDLTPTITLTGGIRETRVKLGFQGCVADNGDGSAAAVITGGGAMPGQCITDLTVQPAAPVYGLATNTLKEKNTSWRAGVNWKPVPGLTTYANISRGYKSGNFPNIVAINAFQYAPIVQEEVTAYEVGYKAQLFDRMLTLNGAVYYLDYKNKQLYALFNLPIIGISESTVNIPKSHVEGGEFEAILRPTTGLVIDASGNYTKTKITKGPANVYFGNTTDTWSPTTGAPPGFVSQTPGDLKGLPFNLSPKWQASVDTSYEWAFNSSLNLFVGGTMTYRSSEYPLVGTDVLTKLPAYTLFDVRAGIKRLDDGWSLSLFGHNVTNKHYFVASQRGFDSTARYSGMPITYGITAGFNF